MGELSLTLNPPKGKSGLGDMIFTFSEDMSPASRRLRNSSGDMVSSVTKTASYSCIAVTGAVVNLLSDVLVCNFIQRGFHCQQPKH